MHRLRDGQRKVPTPETSSGFKNGFLSEQLFQAWDFTRRRVKQRIELAPVLWRKGERGSIRENVVGACDGGGEDKIGQAATRNLGGSRRVRFDLRRDAKIDSSVAVEF